MIVGKNNLRSAAVMTGLALALTSACSVESSPPSAPIASRQLQPINIESLPPKLPKAVQALATRTIRLDTEDNAGTGVIIANNRALTAGHVLPDAGAADSAAIGCKDIKVAGTRQDSGRLFATTAKRAVGQRTDDIGKIPVDRAILQLDADYSADPLPLRSTPLAAGENLYIMSSFQDQGDNQRNPTKDAYSTPAIFGAIALGGTSPNTFDIMTMLKSYGRQSDNRADYGSSGGPVYDGSGQLVGIVSQEYNRGATADDAARQYGLQPAAGQGDTWIRQAIITLTPPTAVAELEQRLDSAPVCTPTN